MANYDKFCSSCERLSSSSSGFRPIYPEIIRYTKPPPRELQGGPIFLRSIHSSCKLHGFPGLSIGERFKTPFQHFRPNCFERKEVFQRLTMRHTKFILKKLEMIFLHRCKIKDCSLKLPKSELKRRG